MSPPTLTPAASNKVCNSLALLQSVASHAETRQLFLNAHIPLFLYPFLNTVSKARPFEYLRLTSLGVIGGLVKMDDPEVIGFLLQTEIIPLCLRIMETGTELSKTVATFVVQKILLDDMGLQYVCQTPERFYAIATVLTSMVHSFNDQPSARLLKHIVRCYLRLTDHPRSKAALFECLPAELRGTEIHHTLRDDSVTRKWLHDLNERLTPPSQQSGATANRPMGITQPQGPLPSGSMMTSGMPGMPPHFHPGMQQSVGGGAAQQQNPSQQTPSQLGSSDINEHGHMLLPPPPHHQQIHQQQMQMHSGHMAPPQHHAPHSHLGNMHMGMYGSSAGVDPNAMNGGAMQMHENYLPSHLGGQPPRQF